MREFTLLAALLISFSVNAQDYYTGFDNANEKAGWTQYKKGVDSAPYVWSYSSMNAYSAPECLSHNYPVGGTQQTDDWFVSPQFNLTYGGVIDSLYYAFSGFGTPMAGDTIALYLLEGAQDPALATSKTILYNFTDSTYMNDNTWRNINYFLLPYGNNDYYFAFRYTTVANWLDVRFDNLYITIATGVEEEQIKSIKIYPNPATDILYLETEYNINSVELTDLQGRRVFISESELKSIDISHLVPGMYTVKVDSDKGMLTQKLIVSE